MKYNYLFNNNSGKGSFGFNLSETFVDEQAFDDAKTVLVAKLNELDIDNINLIGKSIYLKLDFTTLTVSETTSFSIIINGDSISCSSVSVGSPISTKLSTFVSGTLYTKVVSEDANQLKLLVVPDKSFFETGKIFFPTVNDITFSMDGPGTVTEVYTISYEIV